MHYWPSKSHISEVLGQNVNLTPISLKNAKFTIIEHIQAPTQKIEVYASIQDYYFLNPHKKKLQNEWSQCYVSIKIQKFIMRQNRSKSAEKYRTSDPMYESCPYRVP